MLSQPIPTFAFGCYDICPFSYCKLLKRFDELLLFLSDHHRQDNRHNSCFHTMCLGSIPNVKKNTSYVLFSKLWPHLHH